MTQKELDILIDRLKNLIPEAEAFVDKQEDKGKRPYDKRDRYSWSS